MKPLKLKLGITLEDFKYPPDQKVKRPFRRWYPKKIISPVVTMTFTI